MNEFKDLCASLLAKNFVIAAILVSLIALSWHFPTAQAQGGSWRLREIKVFTRLSDYSAVTAETYNKSGGRVDINIDGRALNACPGGLEKVSFNWSFQGDMSRIANGGSFTVNLAGNASEAGACVGRKPFSALSSMAARGSKGGKSPLSDEENRFVDGDRFFNTEDRNYYVYASESKTNSSTSIAVSDYRSAPQYPLAYFEIQLGTRAGDLIRYVYIYQSDGGSNNGGGDNGGGAGWGTTNYNAGLNGKTLTFYRGTTPEQCQADCDRNPNCRGFTLIRAGAYNANDPAMCYLMSEATSFAPSPCCISAIKR
jgi:hypothetical protein